MSGGRGPFPRMGSAAGVAVRGVHAPPSVKLGAVWIGSSHRFSEPTTGWRALHESSYHVPVMVEEVLHFLRPRRGGLYLDGTLGAGGHAEAILGASADAQVIGVDRDPEALAHATARLAPFGDRIRFIRSTFAQATDQAGLGEDTLAGALLDLGISSHQVDEPARGFTFRSGAPLDMRMEGAGDRRSAADLLNELPEEELATIFYRFGE
ncbi:MAG: 16S rRNA (cytosine(1402)-N(4))-methyltransferase, partial [Gemmatimonadota bacterium]